MKEIFEQLIHTALSTENQLNIYTLALHYDPVTDCVSVCIDSKSNSDHQVREQNAYNMKFFKKILDQGNLNEAALWQANVGRNLILGDFRAVNIAETPISGEQVDHKFYLDMAQALMNQADLIASHSRHGSELLFCSSTVQDEVGLIWSYSE